MTVSRPKDGSAEKRERTKATISWISEETRSALRYTGFIIYTLGFHPEPEFPDGKRQKTGQKIAFFLPEHDWLRYTQLQGQIFAKDPYHQSPQSRHGICPEFFSSIRQDGSAFPSTNEKKGNGGQEPDDRLNCVYPRPTPFISLPYPSSFAAIFSSVKHSMISPCLMS